MSLLKVGLGLIFLTFAQLHPFHISVCSINYAATEGSLQITVKIFADDLEEALNQSGNQASAYVDVLNPEDPEKLDVIVNNYLAEHVSFTVNEKAVQPQYLGFEREDLTLWCYLEITGITELQQVKVQNTLLLNTFEDQINIVHIKANDVVKSMKLAKNQTVDTITF
uniref:Uncharacterized protein n=1 Tax=Roseihalotalea indica TaxID=2867963 RepID=A0AA49GIL6_9BACT|nr:hypothetical protein K4G66_18255 [Tunicatimonas sp. TK19036]